MKPRVLRATLAVSIPVLVPVPVSARFPLIALFAAALALCLALPAPAGEDPPRAELLAETLLSEDELIAAIGPRSQREIEDWRLHAAVDEDGLLHIPEPQRRAVHVFALSDGRHVRTVRVGAGVEPGMNAFTIHRDEYLVFHDGKLVRAELADGSVWGRARAGFGVVPQGLYAAGDHAYVVRAARGGSETLVITLTDRTRTAGVLAAGGNGEPPLALVLAPELGHLPVRAEDAAHLSEAEPLAELPRPAAMRLLALEPNGPGALYAALSAGREPLFARYAGTGEPPAPFRAPRRDGAPPPSREAYAAAPGGTVVHVTAEAGGLRFRHFGAPGRGPVSGR